MIIFCFGAILRIWGIDEFPMDSDELGSWFRAINNTSFNDHISNGVMIDGHPAGIQTIVWILSSYFTSETSFKITWCLFSLLNLVLIYSLTLRSFNRSTAVISSIFWSFLHFPIDMSIWVRPYEVALFFQLILVNVLISKSSDSKFQFAFIGITLGLIGYMHYIAFMTSILSLIIFDFYHNNKITLSTIKSLFVAAIIQVPAINIWSQHLLNEKGLSWLGKPSLSFLFEHLYFVSNQSNLIASFFIVLVTSGCYFHWKKNWKSARWDFILIFLIDFLIVWGYSFWIKPIIQHHVLYFMLPFLIIFFAHWISNAAPRWFKMIIIFTSPVVLTISLLAENRHFSNCKLDKYHSPLLHLNEMDTAQPLPEIFFDGPKDIFEYKSNQFPHLKMVHINAADWENSYNKINSKSDSFYVITNSGSDEQFIPLLNSIFNPIPIPRTQYGFWAFPGSQINLYSKAHLTENIINEKLITINIDSNYFISFSEISQTFQELQKNDLIFIECNDKLNGERHIVSAIFTPSFNKSLRQIDYRYTSNKTKIDDSIVIHSIKLSDIPNWNNESTLRLSYENRDHNKLEKQFKLRVRLQKGNPLLYGIPPKQILSLNKD